MSLSEATSTSPPPSGTVLRGRPLVATTRTERDFDNPVARVLVLADRALRSLLPTRPTWRPTLTWELLGQLRGAIGTSQACRSWLTCDGFATHRSQGALSLSPCCRMKLLGDAGI